LSGGGEGAASPRASSPTGRRRSTRGSTSTRRLRVLLRLGATHAETTFYRQACILHALNFSSFYCSLFSGTTCGTKSGRTHHVYRGPDLVWETSSFYCFPWYGRPPRRLPRPRGHLICSHCPQACLALLAPLRPPQVLSARSQQPLPPPVCSAPPRPGPASSKLLEHKLATIFLTRIFCRHYGARTLSSSVYFVPCIKIGDKFL
jgi:hypothetical protein